MLIEALAPLLVKVAGHRFTLEPGKPIDLSEDRALRLLAKVPDKVRVVQPDWLSAWRELADLTVGVTQDDPRFQPVLDALAACDVAFLANDWPAFQWAAAAVRLAVQGARGKRS